MLKCVETPHGNRKYTVVNLILKNVSFIKYEKLQKLKKLQTRLSGHLIKYPCQGSEVHFVLNIIIFRSFGIFFRICVVQKGLH